MGQREGRLGKKPLQPLPPGGGGSREEPGHFSGGGHDAPAHQGAERVKWDNRVTAPILEGSTRKQ